MKRLALAAVLLFPITAAAQTPYTCGMATLRNVETVVDTFATSKTTHVKTRRNRHGDRETWVETTPGERQEKSYVLTVQLGDLLYTAKSAGNFWNFDPTRLVINDPIGVCVDRDRLVFARPDGKDFKARIVRSVRDEAQ